MNYNEPAFLWLVDRASARWQSHPEIDEIKQIAAEAALKQLKRCESSGKTPSQRYLLLRMRAEIAAWHKRNGAKPRYKNPHCASLHDHDAPTEDTGEQRVMAFDFAKHAQTLLTPDEQELLRLKFWEGKTFVEIGEVIGCGKSVAAERLHKVLAKLRESADDLPTQGENKGEKRRRSPAQKGE